MLSTLSRPAEVLLKGPHVNVLEGATLGLVTPQPHCSAPASAECVDVLSRLRITLSEARRPGNTCERH